MPKMRILLTLIFCLFTSKMLFACCAIEEMRSYPSFAVVSQNPIFLIEYTGVKPALKQCDRIYLQDKEGNTYDLSIVEGYGKDSHKDNKQHWNSQHRYALLKPDKMLPANAEVSIMMESNENNEDKHVQKVMQKLKSLSRRSWTVKNYVDNSPPVFWSEISGSHWAMMNSTVPGQGITLQVEAQDDNASYRSRYYQNGIKFKRSAQMLVELTDAEQNKGLYLVQDGRIRLSSAACYSNFALPRALQDAESMDFSYSVRLMDFSGNKSRKSKELRFKLVKRHPIKDKRTATGRQYLRGLERGPEEIEIDNEVWKNVSTEGNDAYVDIYFPKSALDDFAAHQKLQPDKPEQISQSWIAQNKPNPSSEITNISYYLSEEDGLAELQLFDLSGNQIRTIPIDQPGAHSLQLDCSDLNRGVYIYSLLIDGEDIESRKMIVD